MHAQAVCMAVLQCYIGACYAHANLPFECAKLPIDTYAQYRHADMHAVKLSCFA